MTEDEAKILTQRALKHAFFRVVNEQDQEDLAQDAMLKTFENPEWRSGMKMRVLDALRTKIGRKDQPGYNPKTLYGEAVSKDGEDIFDTLDVGQDRDPDTLQAFREICNNLSPEDRCIMFLVYVWEFTLVEVADCLGYSSTRVCQKLSEVHKTVANSLGRAHPKSRNAKMPAIQKQMISRAEAKRLRSIKRPR